MAWSQSICANSALRPFATASPSSGSGCAVKNCHGVLAPYSSPMNSMGVKGWVMSHVAAAIARSTLMDWFIRSPAARLPTWSWFCRNVTNWNGRCSAASISRPCERPRNVEYVPLWKYAVCMVFSRACRDAKSP